jgi:hypothetical protein
MNRSDELIEDSELYVKLNKDLIYNFSDLPDRQAPLDQPHAQEVWQRVQCLGTGGYGEVYKKVCKRHVRGGEVSTFRAVKVLNKGDKTVQV